MSNDSKTYNLNNHLNFEKVSIFAILIATLTTSCIPVSLPPSLTASPTPSATISPIPTQTNTPSPSPTETLTPTPTQTLTPQQQRERDFGTLVPRSETCVKYAELHMSMPEYIPTDVAFAELMVHATDNIRLAKIPMGRDKEEREVTMLQVVCRDKNGNIAKPMWLVLGGKDFGEKKDGTNIFWFTTPEGFNGIRATTVDVILQSIPVGLEITVKVPVKLGSTQPNNLRNRFYSDGTSNELANESLRQFAKNKEQIKLIIDGQGVDKEDFILIPLMITLGPLKSP